MGDLFVFKTNSIGGNMFEPIKERVQDSAFFRLNIDFRKLWQFSILIYMVCHVAFYYSGSFLSFLNPITMYFFLFVSAFCMFQKGYVKINYYLVPMFVFLVLLIIGFLYADMFKFEVFYKYFVITCIAFCFINYIESEKDIEYILKAVMCGGIVMVIYSAAIYGDSLITDILNHSRIGENVGNANEVGLRASYSALIALYFLLNEKGKKASKIIYACVIPVGLLYSLLTASKKVLLLLAFGIVYMLIVSIKKKSAFSLLKALVISTAVIAVVIYIIYNVKYFEFMRDRIEQMIRFITNGSGSGSDNERWYFMTTGFRVFMDNLFLGDGTGASYYHFDTYSHSNFIELLMNYGLVGFAVFYSPYPAMIYDCICCRKHKTERTNLSFLCLFIILSILYLSVALVYYNDLFYQLLLTVSVTYAINLKKSKGTELR